MARRLSNRYRASNQFQIGSQCRSKIRSFESARKQAPDVVFATANPVEGAIRQT